jgi:ferric-dicitrate binding protein FerR (iron transport regulator)
MELLLLLLLVPIAWLVLLPSRIASHVRRYRFTGAGLLAGAAVAAWVGFQFLAPSQQQKIDYAAGDTELRAILLHPETAPRYSRLQ